MLAEHGHVNTNSTRVSKAAGVSPATFYQHFDNIGDCLLAAHEAASDCVVEIVSEACREERDRLARAAWRRGRLDPPLPRGRAGDRPPARHRTAGRGACDRGRPQAWIDRLAALLAAAAACDRRMRPSCRPGPSAISSPAPSAIFSEWVAAGDVDRLPELAPELTEMLAAPYVS